MPRTSEQKRWAVAFAPLLLLLISGCSAVKTDTVGLRIFDPESRFFDDEVYIDIIDPSGQSVIVSNLVSGGDWAPAEVYHLQTADPVIIRVRYTGADVGETHLKDRRAEQIIDMVQDYDVYIRWRPDMQRPSSDDEENPEFDFAPHWARKPEFEIRPGHTPIF